MSTDVSIRGDREVTTFDTEAGVLRIPTQINGVHLTFVPDQRVLTEQQMVLLAPLNIEANWDPRQVAVFLMECQQRGMDPWQREAYLMRYRDRSAPDGHRYVRHIGIDGFRKRGESTGQYRGRIGPLWCDEDEQWRETWPYRDRAPAAAKVGIRRTTLDDVQWNVAMYDEYVPMADEYAWDASKQANAKTGKKVPTPAWRTAAQGGKPALMVGKVAEAGAWRVAFPQRFGGFYAPEELERDRDVPQEDPAAAKRRAAFRASQPAPAAESAIVEPVQPEYTDADRELLLAELDEQAEVLGKSVTDLCSRWSASRNGQDIKTATPAEVADHVHRIRPYVLEELTNQARDDEAAVYAAAPLVGTVHELFGRGPAVVEPPAEVSDDERVES